MEMWAGGPSRFAAKRRAALTRRVQITRTCWSWADRWIRIVWVNSVMTGGAASDVSRVGSDFVNIDAEPACDNILTGLGRELLASTESHLRTAARWSARCEKARALGS